MFAKLSGRLFQSWAALYENDIWEISMTCCWSKKCYIKLILSLSLFLAGISCMHLAQFLSWTFSLHKDGGANPFIHLKAIKVTKRIRLKSNTFHWFFNKSKFQSDIYRLPLCTLSIFYLPGNISEIEYTTFMYQHQRNLFLYFTCMDL